MQDNLHEEAMRLASTIMDFDAREDQTRAVGDNVRRHNRLLLGAFIHAHSGEAKDLIRFLAANTSFSKAEIKDYAQVAAWNAESGYGDFLSTVKMSFTVNRTLAGIRTKQRRGARVMTTQERIDALEKSIERNVGFAKDDREFREDLGILPPPNSVANIMERAKEDPEFRETLLHRGMVVVLHDDEDVAHRQIPSRVSPFDEWDDIMIRLRTTTRRIRDAAFEDESTPQRVGIEAAEAIKDLQAVVDLLQGRAAMADAEVEP